MKKVIQKLKFQAAMILGNIQNFLSYYWIVTLVSLIIWILKPWKTKRTHKS